MKEATLKVKLHQGDLLAQEEGVVVVPVNNFFDTHLGDGIVCPRTIHGQFLEMCKTPPDELSKLIHLDLEEYEVSGKTVERNSDGKVPELERNRISYPLGSSVFLNSKDIGFFGDTEYLLLALTEFDHNNKVIPNIGSTAGAIVKLLHDEMASGLLPEVPNHYKYHLPLLGSGKGGLTEVESLTLMLTSPPFCFLRDSVSNYGEAKSTFRTHFDINIFHRAKPEVVDELNKVIQNFGVY